MDVFKKDTDFNFRIRFAKKNKMIPLIDNITDFVRDIFGAIFVNKTEKLKAETILKELDNGLQQLETTGELQQIIGRHKLAIMEAQHRSIFVSGYRPFFGWICGIAITYDCIIRPFFVAFGVPVPQLDIAELTTIAFSFIGLSGYRTYEKKQGLTK